MRSIDPIELANSVTKVRVILGMPNQIVETSASRLCDSRLVFAVLSRRLVLASSNELLSY
ncbi:MAG: hypothetical protein QXN83_08935 [Nitrososphaerales archaeon]